MRYPPFCLYILVFSACIQILNICNCILYSGTFLTKNLYSVFEYVLFIYQTTVCISNYIGYSEQLLAAFCSMLSLSQLVFVSYGGYKSKLCVVKQGESQASNLGPLLFLFLSLSYENLKCGDNAILFCIIHSVGYCFHLQGNLVKDKLILNTTKSFTRVKNSIQFEYSLNFLHSAI